MEYSKLTKINEYWTNKKQRKFLTDRLGVVSTLNCNLMHQDVIATNNTSNNNTQILTHQQIQPASTALQ